MITVSMTGSTIAASTKTDPSSFLMQSTRREGLKSEHGFTDKEAKQFMRVFAAASFFARDIEPYDPPDPLPEFARRRRGLDPAQNPWTKWLPDIEAFCNAE
jgi:hypothetical protein